MADVAQIQGPDQEREHRDRLARAEGWPVSEDGKTMEEEGRDSARMLGCAMICAVAVILAIVALLVVGPWSN